MNSFLADIVVPSCGFPLVSIDTPGLVKRYVIYLQDCSITFYVPRVRTHSQQPPPGLSLPIGDIGQISNDFVWVATRKREGRPTMCQIRQVCEIPSPHPPPATDDNTALEPNTIVYAHASTPSRPSSNVHMNAPTTDAHIQTASTLGSQWLTPSAYSPPPTVTTLRRAFWDEGGIR